MRKEYSQIIWHREIMVLDEIDLEYIECSQCFS